MEYEVVAARAQGARGIVQHGTGGIAIRLAISSSTVVIQTCHDNIAKTLQLLQSAENANYYYYYRSPIREYMYI